MNSDFTLRRAALGCAAALVAATIATGCAGGRAYQNVPNSGGGGASCVTTIAPAGTEVIGLNLTNPYQTPCTDRTYQLVQGFFGGVTIVTSQVLSVTHSSTNAVQFMNVDVQPHTAASLGAWSGSYPSAGPNPAATASPKLTDISAPGFTTGNLNPGTTSRSYVANVPGIYVIGCAYHYQSNNMRTVIIVM